MTVITLSSTYDGWRYVYDTKRHRGRRKRWPGRYKAWQCLFRRGDVVQVGGMKLRVLGVPSLTTIEVEGLTP